MLMWSVVDVALVFLVGCSAVYVFHQVDARDGKVPISPNANPGPYRIGAMTASHLDTKNAANLSLATRFLMQPNDIVFIAEQPITRWNRAFRQIFPTIIGVGNAVNN